MDTVLSTSDTLSIRVKVTDSAANVRYFTAGGVVGSAAELVSEIAMGGITFAFSEPVLAGLDQTGRAYVVDPGDGVTVTSITPAQTTSGGLIINGAQKNLSRSTRQGLDQRLSAWNATYNSAVPISLSAGERLIKAVSSLDGSVGDRDGNIAEFACLHCVTNAPTATQVLGPTQTWSGDTVPEVYDFDLDAFYAARTTQSSANITWFDYSTKIGQLGQFYPTFPSENGALAQAALSPRGFGGVAGLGNKVNYGEDLAQTIGDFMLATTVAAGGAFTEAQIKQAILTTLMHGIEWGIPLSYGQAQNPDGGIYQWFFGPTLFALKALGLEAAIPTFMADGSGNLQQAFKITSLADFAPHTEQFKPWFSRQRTLSTQPGGSVISLPLKILNEESAVAGWDMGRDAGMPIGTRFVRVSDGVTAVSAQEFKLPKVNGDPLYIELNLTAANPFSSGDVIFMLPPVAEPLQVGSYDWSLRGTPYINGYSPHYNAGYRQIQKWAGQLLALKAHGVSDASMTAAYGIFEWGVQNDKPSATNDYTSMMTAIAGEYEAENWIQAWSVLTAPAAFVLANWTLDAGGNVEISTLPDNGGALITSIEYRLNGGTWTAASGIAEYSVVNGATVDFTIPAYAGQNVEIRAVNLVGSGAASDVKSA